MTLPVFRHSDFERWEACAFAYGSTLLSRAVRECRRGGDPRDVVARHTCDEGADYIVAHCGSAGVPRANRATSIGVQFHRFAHAYGAYCRRHNIRSDWPTGDRMAHGFARGSSRLYEIMLLWMQCWEYSPAGAENAGIPLVTGSFETGQRVEFDCGGRRISYVWHPDYARISDDLTHLTITDWKSGLSMGRIDPSRPAVQLQRYALGFSLLYPTLRTATLEVWFVNPDHPLFGSPVTWQRDLQDRPLERALVTGPAEAILQSPEFPASPGCWLCPFCEWAAHCPASDQVAMVCDCTPQDAATAWELRGSTYGLSNQLTAHRSALLQLVNAAVAQHGAIPVHTDKQGNVLAEPRNYGPRLATEAEVPSIRELLAEAAQRGRDVTGWLRIEGAEDLATYLGMEDPFSDNNEAFESVRLAHRVVYDVHDPEGAVAAPPQQPTPETAQTVKRKLGELNVKRAHRLRVTVGDQPETTTIRAQADPALEGVF